MASGKEDMDRIGLFKEMEYVTVKDPYKEASKSKSRVIMCGDMGVFRLLISKFQ